MDAKTPKSTSSYLCALSLPYLTFLTHACLIRPCQEYPQYDQFNPLKYIPSLPLAIVATVLYALVSLATLLLLVRYGQKWMLTIILGSLAYSFGMAVRLWFRVDTVSDSIMS